MLLLCLHNQPPLIHLSVRRHEANVQATYLPVTRVPNRLRSHACLNRLVQRKHWRPVLRTNEVFNNLKGRRHREKLNLSQLLVTLVDVQINEELL